MDTASIFWGLLFGAIGAGFFVYGKKQGKPVPLLCGIALAVFPYFVSNLPSLVALGIVLCAIPYFYRP
ncbi:hypothetical protein [Paucibacter soli]|uniref:hypothetical protein n=1 Tax=Paucibacter soli TaxID=3133433 RepID=UPI00309CFE18